MRRDFESPTTTDTSTDETRGLFSHCSDNSFQCGIEFHAAPG